MAQLNNLLVTGDSRFLNEIHGNIDGYAGAILDNNNKTNPITIEYSSSGISTASWFPAFSGYAIKPISAANLRTAIGAGTSSFSGNYNDLTNKPTIPTVNNATLTIQKNGTNVQTFTANQSTNVTANITVPTKVSELTNDSGYTTLTIGTTATTAMAGNTNVNNVTQTNTTDNADYRVLLSYGANDTTQTNTIQKNTNLKYNPSTGNLQTTKLNGVTVGSSPKFTDTDTHRPIKVNGSTILGDNTAAFNLVSGDNIHMAITGSGSVTIHSDQIDDSYTYSQYRDLSDSIKMQDKIFMVKDAPNPPAIPIVDEYAREQIVDIKSDLTDKMYYKEIDAIGPVSAGGTIDLNNYITDWADSFKIEFYLRRWGRVGFVSIPTNLARTDVAVDVNYSYQGNIRTCGLNSSGVFTVSGAQTDPVFIDIIAYYGTNQQPS